MYSQLSIHDQWPINCLLLINHRLISYHNQNGQVVNMLHIYWKPVPNWNLFGISGTDFWPRFRPKGGREVFVWRRHTWQSILLKIIQSTTVFSAKCKLSRPLPCWNTDYLDHMDWFFMDFILLSIFDYFQCTMQIDSSTASLELLTCDLTNKDEAISINKVIIVVITTAPL